MTDLKQHTKAMVIALETAKLALPVDVPVGAVLMKGEQIIASAYNRRDLDNNPIGHAEMLVLQQAAHVLENWRLKDTILYVTLEPCPMCAWAISQARVGRVVYGAHDLIAGACGSKYHLLPADNNKPEVIGGILESSCQALLQRFFQERRQEAR